MTDQPPALSLLSRTHTVMADPQEHDIRRPDLAWVFGDPAHYQYVSFGCVSSEFWIGPLPQALAFAEQLAAQYAAWAPLVTNVNECCDHPGAIAVACWESVEQGLGMVAAIPLFDSYRSMRVKSEADDPRRHLPALTAFPDMRQVGFEGNDNSAFELVHEIEAFDDPSHARTFARFLRSVTTAGFAEDMEETLDESLPGWKTVKQ